MLEEFMKLFKRLVVAQEKIADQGTRSAIRVVDNTPNFKDAMNNIERLSNPEFSPEENPADWQEPTAPSVPAPPVPTPPVPAPPVNDTEELDAEGFPWDERIHTPARTRVKKTNTWKLIRQIEETSPGLVEKVKVEYLDAGPDGNTDFEPATVPTPPVPAPPVEMQETVDTVVNPPAPTTDETLTFPKFVSLVTAAGLTVATIQPFLDSHDVKALPELAAKPEVMQAVATALGVWNATHP